MQQLLHGFSKPESRTLTAAFLAKLLFAFIAGIVLFMLSTLAEGAGFSSPRIIMAPFVVLPIIWLFLAVEYLQKIYKLGEK